MSATPKTEQAGHTPGPWRLNINNELRISASDGIGVATTSGVTPRRTQAENEANAKLIAAAPETAAERDRLLAINAELLEALRQLHSMHRAFSQNDNWTSLDDEARALAEAAIARAERQVQP